MTKTLRSLIVAVLACMLLAGPALAAKILRISDKEDPKTANCQMTTDFYTIPLNVFDRLVEAVTVAPGESELVPGLAESWEISKDGLVYTFHLRKGVLFHNGEEFTADDVVYTFDRMLNPKTKALNTDILDFIDGAEERLDGKADSTKGLVAVDKYTVKITLETPYAPFIAVLASPQASIFNRKFSEAAGDRFGLSPETTCGTGPFILKKYVLNDRQELVANEKYFRGKSKIDGILIRVVPDPETMRLLFETDELDVFDCDYAITQIPYFDKSKKWKSQLVSGPRVGLYYFSMNQRIKPFDDVRVRKAFQMSIDRKAILEKQYYGRGQLENAIIPRGLVCYEGGGKTIEYNPAKAKALLAEAGYPNGVDATIVQVSSWSAQWDDINMIVQSMTKKIGFNITIKQVDESAYFATRKTGDIEAYSQVWSADFNDPDNFLYTFFSKRGTVVRSFNNMDPVVFEGLDKARSMTDPAARCALYRQLEERIVYEDAAWVPLFSLDHIYVVQPRVKNFVVPWNGWSSMNYYKTELE